MGQRCNLVIVRDGDWRLYYDHWAANRLDAELFFGPAAATAFIEARDPQPDRRDWLDEVWAEGGAVIDHDKRALIWYGGEDILYDIPRRRSLLALMRVTWPGWQLRWAAGGIAELGALFGLDPAAFTTRAPESFHGDFTFNAADPDGNDTLVTTRRAGRLRVGRTHGFEAILTGPRLTAALHRLARHDRLDWTGPFPTAGIHLDEDTRTLGLWCAPETCDLEARLTRAWPGWRCLWWRDAYEPHLAAAAADITLPAIDLAALQRDLIATLREQCHHEARNPARESLAALQREGTLQGPIELNPFTDITRASAGDPIEKHRLLDALEARLPITPAP